MSLGSENYRHVVLFKFKDETPAATVRAIEQAFSALCAALPFVRGFEWGVNSSPEGLSMGFTHCFIVSFADAAARDVYLPHPLHQAFCRQHLDAHLEKACVVDFLPSA
ncbi:MAG: Dabb family protein [Uliginosibacterium sp.]|nr:Dabb family protein [Uliginosibacterium sp.]